MEMKKKEKKFRSVHLILQDEKKMQLTLEVEFAISYVDKEIHLNRPILLRPYITYEDDKYTFPVETNSCNLQHAYTIFFLALNAARINNMQFFVNIEDALKHHRLSEINTWLGKSHRLQEILAMLESKLRNPFFDEFVFSVNTKPSVLALFARNKLLETAMQKYLQTNIKT